MKVLCNLTYCVFTVLWYFSWFQNGGQKHYFTYVFSLCVTTKIHNMHKCQLLTESHICALYGYDVID